MLSGHWTGVREAQESIKAMGTAFSEPVLEGALKRLAEPIKDEIVQRLEQHRVTGLTAEDIAVVVSKEGRESGAAAVIIGARRGKGGRAFILRFLEYGTFRQPARPVVRPAWDAAEPGYPERALAELRKAYERGVKRFSRRAA
ncbi:MAG: hypothetical protein A2V88_15965 [Elusimicrobia bacterium RBG_16_66_12]|nr:MAG: hypothetical protein A2V88_15965 [Elusimicrobia bacterium RBG_16_66_12]